MSLFTAETTLGYAPQCGQLFGKDSTASLDANFDKRDKRLITATLSRIFSFVNGLTLPELTIKKMTDHLVGSSYLTGNDQIKFKLAAKGRKRSDIVTLAHEVGHAIFDYNLKFQLFDQHQTIAEAAKFLKTEKTKISKEPEVLPMVNELALLESNLGQLTPAQDYKKSELKRKINNYISYNFRLRFSKQEKKFIALDGFLLVFNELFADMVAVMTTRDGRAVSNTFTLEGPEGIMQNLTRDFTKNTSIENFELSRKNIFDTKELPEYEGLNPARSYLWRRYLSKLPPTFYPQILRGFLAATHRQVELYEVLIKDEVSYINDYQRLNKDFIQFLEEELGHLAPESKPLNT